MDGEIYFAYGSCMDEKDFRRTVPNAELLGAAVLPGYKMDFTTYSYTRRGGAADITALEGYTVQGVAWFVPAAKIRSLDAREGAPFFYERKNVRIIIEGAETSISAITYEVVEKEEASRPTDDYLNLIVSGALNVGISEEYIDSIIARADELEAKIFERKRRKSSWARYSSSTYPNYNYGNSYRRNSGYVWDTKPVGNSRWYEEYEDDFPAASSTYTPSLFSDVHEGSRLDSMTPEELAVMTDEEIEAEIAGYNWWNDDDYRAFNADDDEEEIEDIEDAVLVDDVPMIDFSDFERP